METEASKVVHLSNVPRNVTKEEIYQVAGQFGTIAHHVALRSKQQALVEMSDVHAALAMVQYYEKVRCYIRNEEVDVVFSNHQELNRKHNHNASGETQPNRILLVTVHDCAFPINVDITHQIFANHGMIEKIVVFEKPVGLQILVQFTHVESATEALVALQGRHIYAGVCKLQIQFSKLADLTVTRNNERSRDYNNPNLPTDTPALLPTPDNNPPAQSSLYDHPPYATHANGQYSDSQVPTRERSASDRCVLLVSNLDTEKSSCRTLFNLFSGYGRVEKIKIMYNKPDHALVQMGEHMHATSAMRYLKNVVVFGKPMNVTFSKHAYINVAAPREDSDEDQESPNAVDYSHSKLNRFRSVSSPGNGYPSKPRHIYPPSPTLHLSNLAPNVTEQELINALSTFGTPVASTMFEANGRTMCLMQFESVEVATDIICMMHNETVNGYSLRIAFSRSTVAK